MIIDTTCSIVERKMNEEKSKPNHVPGGPESILINNGSINNIFVSNQCLSDKEVENLSGETFTCSIGRSSVVTEVSTVTAEVPAITWTTWCNGHLQNSIVCNFD